MASCRSIARRAGGSIVVKQQAIAPNDTAVAGVSHRDGNGQNAGDIDHNHEHIEEVIHSDNNHLGLLGLIIAGFAVVTGRLEQPVNRR